jgi:hypothetical protein
MKKVPLMGLIKEPVRFKPPSLLDKAYIYVPAAKTDVRETWKKNGWIPPQKGESK